MSSDTAHAVRPSFSFADFRSAIKGHPLRTFLICFAGFTLCTTDQALFAYAIPGIQAEFSIPLQTISQILSLSFLVASLTVVIAGVLTDYIGRKRMFTIALALSAVCVGMHAVSQTLGWLTVFRVLGFATAAAVYPITNTIMVEVAPARYRGFASGLLQIGYPIGFGLAALIAAPLIGAYGWRASFVPAFLVIPVALVLGRLLTETARFNEARGAADHKPERRSITEHMGELFRPPLLRRTVSCFMGSFMLAFALGVITYFLPTFFVEDRGMSSVTAAKLTGFSYAIGAIGYVMAAYTGEFLTTRRNTVIIGAWLGAIALCCTVWFAESEIALVIGFGVSVMFFFGQEAVRMPLTAEIFPTRVRTTGTVMAGALSVTTAWFLAPMVLAAVVGRVGWTWAFTYLAVLPLLIGGVAFLSLQNIQSGLEVEQISS